MANATMFQKKSQRKEIDLSEKSLGTLKKLAGAGASLLTIVRTSKAQAE